MAVDSPIQHANSQEDDEEDDDREKDVGFGVEREEGGTFLQATNAVPAQEGEEAYHQSPEPAEGHKAEDPAVAFPG